MAVDLLDENKCFEKSDWPYCGRYSDFEGRKRSFSMNNEFQGETRKANLDPDYDNYGVQGQVRCFYGKMKKI